MHTHIIYYVTHNDTIIYIGSGLPNRYKHTESGVSHVYELNRLHFTEPSNVSTFILKGYSSQEKALEEEQKLILEFKPKCNNQWLDDSSERFSISSKEILKYKGEFIVTPNEYVVRKQNNYYETIELGLEPSIVNAIKYYEDPLTDNEILFKAFPKFKQWIDVGITTNMMNTVGRKREAIDQISDSNRRLSTFKEDMLKVLNLKINGIYPKAELKVKIQEYYDKRSILLKAKASDIQDYFDVKTTTNTKGIGCFKIIKKL